MKFDPETFIRLCNERLEASIYGRHFTAVGVDPQKLHVYLKVEEANNLMGRAVKVGQAVTATFNPVDNSFRLINVSDYVVDGDDAA